MHNSNYGIQFISKKITGKSIVDSLSEIAKLFPDEVAFTTSFGIEDQVITHLIFTNNIPIRVISLDTGRLFEETYKVFSNTLKRYNRKIEVFTPQAEALGKLLAEKGPFSFYKSVEDRKECCEIRKLEPQRRALKGMKCWITGIRAGQSKDRRSTSNLEVDRGLNLIKFHPLHDWSLKEVENYLADYKIPYNELHDKRFFSIGCAPCTRAVKVGEDLRSGRWWWENSTAKECGLHKSLNTIISDTADHNKRINIKTLEQ